VQGERWWGGGKWEGKKGESRKGTDRDKRSGVETNRKRGGGEGEEGGGEGRKRKSDGAQ